jgi:hypothetical protein
MEEKISLPIKTKIAAWWLIFLGIIGILLSIVGILRGGEIWVIGIFLFLPSMLCSFLPALLLLLIKNKWAWIFTIIMLLIGIGIIVIGLFFFDLPWEYGWEYGDVIIFSISLFVLLIPFILLLFDYKNLGKGWTKPIFHKLLQLPTTTRIAILLAIIGPIFMCLLPVFISIPSFFASYVGSIIIFPFTLSFLLTRKKWLWEFLFIIFLAVVILTPTHYLNIIYQLYEGKGRYFYEGLYLNIWRIFFVFITPLIFPIVPFVLLNLDKRNYSELIKEEITPILATKTVAVMMLLLGGIIVYFGIGTLFLPWMILLLFHWILPVTLVGVLSFVSGLFLLTKKKFGWWLTILSLLIFLYCNLTYRFPIPPFFKPGLPSPIFQRIPNLLPIVFLLFLLLLDRKNFWKVAK